MTSCDLEGLRLVATAAASDDTKTYLRENLVMLEGNNDLETACDLRMVHNM